MKRAQESEMNAVKIITNDLNEATMRLQEAADEECSLRSLVNPLRMELEDMRREHKQLKEKEVERLAIEEQKQAEENLKLDQMLSEAAGARREAEKMHGMIEILRKEAEAARIAAEEAEKRLELVIRGVGEVKAAEERVHNEMKVMSQKQGNKKQAATTSTSKIKITLQEFESLKRGRESEKMVETNLVAVATQLEEINARKIEAEEKSDAKLKAIEEIKTATDLAKKSAEAAKRVV